MGNPVEGFRVAMRACGLDYAGPITADGRLHRFNAEGDHARNSWYVLHADCHSPAAGAFGCWKRSISKTWCDRSKPITPEQWDRIHSEWQQAIQERQRQEEARRQKALNTASWIWARATPITTHPYLEKKGIKVFNGARAYREMLVIPLRHVNGGMLSLQFIDASGNKRFLKHGQIAGTCFTLAWGDLGSAVICEGVATGASIFEATAYGVVCAMNCHNLAAVAQAMRSRWPSRDIVIAGDNDQWTNGNPGLRHAISTAQSIGARLAIPVFTEMTGHPTDFNDLHAQAGLDEVRRQIEAATFVSYLRSPLSALNLCHDPK